MTVQLATQTLARFAPEAIKAAQSLLYKLATQEAAQVVNVATQATNTVSHSLTDSGVSQAVHLARQGLLPELESFAGLLNGELPKDKKDLIFQIIGLSKEDKTLSPEHSKNLREILEHVVSNPGTTDPGTGSLDNEAQELNVDEVSKDIPTTGDKDTTTKGAEKDKPQKPKRQRFNTEEEVAKADEENPELPTSPEDRAFDVVTDNVKKILRREFLNKSSWIGLAAQVAETTGMGKIDDIEKFIDEKLLTDQFKEGLRNSILGNKVDAEGFSPIQSKAFKVASWSIWAIDKMPKPLIQYFPLLTTVIKFTMPIWTHISFLRKPLGTLYPFIDEVSNFVGKFQDETNGIKDAVAQIKPKPRPTSSLHIPEEEELF